MNTKEIFQQTAPCGIDCFNCEIHEKNITDQMRQRMAAVLKRNEDDIPCQGCRQSECRILPEPCATRACIQEKGLDFCYQCQDFPCALLQPAKDGADKYPHNFKLFNLCRIKAVGLDRWAADESKAVRQRYFSGRFVPGRGPVLNPE
jgi:hypothetical protein